MKLDVAGRGRAPAPGETYDDPTDDDADLVARGYWERLSAALDALAELGDADFEIEPFV